ncbi:MMPL family transporter [Mumia zhuanghuii]|uniref:MMPL family transporter n=2 Tax=Mumia TaxID=1546255 RepID=A0ABW1QH58_9ACTN|nr:MULTISPECIES: efflux RND transporter permease subunit [Mumia]KAA1422800.1 MMPL family transporter [Mumia zhuanghuii]
MARSEPARGSHSRVRWVLPVVVVIVWLVLGGLAGPFAGKLGEVAENDTAAFLPESAESTEVAAIQARFAPDSVPLVIVWESDEPISAEGRAAAADQLAAVGRIDGIEGPGRGPVPSEDGRALAGYAQIDPEAAGEVETVVDDVRATVDDVDGATAYVTGPGGFAADIGSAFGGIDGLLLGVALVVVLVILLVVYRSPLLPFAVLLTSVLGLGLAAFVVYQLADAGVLDLNGQSQGIMSILVVGAATDYALLLVARYREELRAHEDRFTAMRVAWRRALRPVLASGSTVILGLLCLLLSDLTSNRSLGPVAALGIAAAMFSALTFLPAVLVLLGRAAFWPFRPHVGSAKPEESGIWGSVARLVKNRPRRLWAGATLALVLAAAFAPTFSASGVSQSDILLGESEAVTGQEAVARHFPGGSGSPAVVVAPEGDLEEVERIVAQVDGVATMAPMPAGGDADAADAPPKVVDGLVMLEVTLADPADSHAAEETVRNLRTELHELGDGVLVGGETAQQVDGNDVAEHDRTLIIPVVLLVILLVLIVLLRSVLAPVLLVATTVLSFFSTLGVAGLVFDHAFGWPGADPSVPLYAFVFLVALGIDYNIFLMTRVREESVRRGTREGILHGLVVTGGVITSAGVVLAATFSALAVIPILFLAQIAFLVAFGVLLDTLIVRSLLVPALSYDIGSRIWWPSGLQRRR